MTEETAQELIRLLRNPAQQCSGAKSPCPPVINCDASALLSQSMVALAERNANLAAQAMENHQKYILQFDALQMQTLFGRQPKPL